MSDEGAPTVRIGDPDDPYRRRIRTVSIASEANNSPTVRRISPITSPASDGVAFRPVPMAQIGS